MRIIILSCCLLMSLVSCGNVRQDVLSVSIDEDVLGLSKGETYRLSVTVDPGDATDKVNWVSTDLNVVAVSDDGLVTAVAAGDAKVVAEVQGVLDYCQVTVAGVPVDTVCLNITDHSLSLGETVRLEASVLPEDADVAEVVWTTSDPEVASVSADGLVTALDGGVSYVRASAGNKSAVCRIMVLGLPDLGDFFYSDGSYSEELLDDKDVVGVVFWIGDPSEDDRLLREDHPECRNGLVVAAKGMETSYWQVDYAGVGEWIVANAPEYVTVTTGTGKDDNLNRKLGYNNTRATMMFNEANPDCAVGPVNALARFEDVLKAPDNTSGWYFPSTKELSLLCSGEQKGNIFDLSGFVSNRERVNDRLKMLQDADVLTLGMYWSSSEFSEREAFMMDFNYAVIGCREKEYAMGNIRYVLAF